MSRRRRSHSGSSSIVEFFRKDPFGVIWFSLAYLGVLIAKWWYLQPPSFNANACLACVIAIVMVLAISITFLISLFWIMWSAKQQAKGIVFLFLICLAVLGCTALLDFSSKKLFSQLYFSGFLNWQETDVSFLLDDFLRHCAGIYLGVLMVYAMARIAVSNEFVQRKFVVPINIFFIGISSFLLFIGIMLY